PAVKPDCASKRAPVHTLATHWQLGAAARIHSSVASSFAALRVPYPPGMTSRSSRGEASNAQSAMTCRPCTQHTTPDVATTVSAVRLAPHSRALPKTSHGPTKSSSSKPSKMRMPTIVPLALASTCIGDALRESSPHLPLQLIQVVQVPSRGLASFRLGAISRTSLIHARTCTAPFADFR